MSTKISLTIASLFLMIASTCTAQGPQFNDPVNDPVNGPALAGPDLNGPVLLGPEAVLGQPSEPLQIPGQGLTPIPESVFANPGGVMLPALDAPPVLIPAGQCDFFQHVRYKNKGKISPCAQTMVISVLDPCTSKCDCATKCVQVKICVPTCGCPKVRISRTGRHTRYDYGKYAIDIYSNRNGTILVDYDA